MLSFLKSICASCCVCMHAHTEQYVISEMQSNMSAACSIESSLDTIAATLKMHASWFINNMNPMMPACSSFAVRPGLRTWSSQRYSESTKTLRTLNTTPDCSARHTDRKCSFLRYSTCTLATTRTSVSSSVARQRTANTAKRRDKIQVSHTVLSSTLPPRNSRRACAFPPRECASCPEGFARRLLHSLDSF